MAYIKPQSPINFKGNYVYPLTTYDQVIMPDGSRWTGEVSSGSEGITVETDPTVPAWAKQANPPTYTKEQVGLGNVDNVKQYSASNPPPYPVTSVNGMTGAVTIDVSGSGSSVNPYPVGAIYMSVNSTSPASLFGGTWTQLKDRFLLGQGSTYKTVNATGGSASVTLTTSQIPSHQHVTAYPAESSWADITHLDAWETPMVSGTMTQVGASGANGYWASFGTMKEGGGSSHENMPPYLVVYMWKRTA